MNSKKLAIVAAIFIVALKFALIFPFSNNIFCEAGSSYPEYASSNEGEASASLVTTSPHSLIMDLFLDSLHRIETIKADLMGQINPTPHESILGTPNLSSMVPGYLQTVTDPYYWYDYAYDALINGLFMIPKPFDIVKPEFILPTAKVPASDEPLPFSRNEVDLSDITYEWRGRHKTVEQYINTTQTDAFIFLRDGEIVFEDYSNGWSAEVRNPSWSVTKSFTSALVGIAWKEGKIDSVHDPIEKYVEELENTVWEGTTIENLLQMESGVFWDEYEAVLAFNPQVQQWLIMMVDYYSGGVLGMNRNDFLKSLPRVAEPGEEFVYNSGDTQVLTWMLETLYDASYAEILSEKLWKPLGMEQEARIITDGNNRAIASMGLFARGYDLARFGELYRNNGQAMDGEQIIPPEWIERSTTFTEASEGDYGYQFLSTEEEEGSSDNYEAAGFQGNRVTVFPEKEIVGVRLSHQLGVNLRPDGENPFDPRIYGFEVEMGGEEWNAVSTAVAEKLSQKDS